MNNSNQFCVLYSIRDNDGMSSFDWDSKKNAEREHTAKLVLKTAMNFKWNMDYKKDRLNFVSCAVLQADGFW